VGAPPDRSHRRCSIAQLGHGARSRGSFKGTDRRRGNREPRSGAPYNTGSRGTSRTDSSCIRSRPRCLCSPRPDRPRCCCRLDHTPRSSADPSGDSRRRCRTRACHRGSWARSDHSRTHHHGTASPACRSCPDPSRDRRRRRRRTRAEVGSGKHCRCRAGHRDSEPRRGRTRRGRSGRASSRRSGCSADMRTIR